MWQSVDPFIATVSSSGVVSGRHIGTTMVIAPAKKSSDTTTIVVHTPITSLGFPYELTIALGGSSQLSFYAYDRSGKLVQFSPGSARWTSLSPGVVSVSSSGVATGKLLGTATIRIDMNGKTATTSVQVVQIPKRRRCFRHRHSHRAGNRNNDPLRQRLKASWRQRPSQRIPRSSSR